MGDIALLKVGDTVMWQDVNHGSRPVKVTKVGRKYLYIVGDKGGYDRHTGKRVDEWGHTYLQTVEAFQLACDVVKAKSEMRQFGIEFRGISGLVVLEIYDAVAPIIGASPRQSDPQDEKGNGT